MKNADPKDKVDIIYANFVKASEKFIHDHLVTKCKEQNINYNPNEPTEDLKAFERRLREIINGLGPKAFKWRIVLSVAVLIHLCSSYCWLVDPVTYQAGFIGSLEKHPEFVLSLLFLMALFFLGAHKKVVLPSIIAHRSRIVLAEYNMACDNSGKLILRPKPNL